MMHQETVAGFLTAVFCYVYRPSRQREQQSIRVTIRAATGVGKLCHGADYPSAFERALCIIVAVACPAPVGHRLDVIRQTKRPWDQLLLIHHFVIFDASADIMSTLISDVGLTMHTVPVYSHGSHRDSD